MPFYKMLNSLLNTATSRARRSCWEPGYYISKGFKNSCMSIIQVSPGENFNYAQYSASCEDLIANDWEVYNYVSA